MLLLIIQSPDEIPMNRDEIHMNRDENRKNRGRILIMWYNVENLFHPEDDSIPGDDEFTPTGVRRWTYTRYRKKLTAISKVIIAAGRWDPPDLVGLCEIENEQVLEDLIHHPILAPYQYLFLHKDSPDRRGMDVACLYREKRFRPTGWEMVASEFSNEDRATRDMMHVWGAWGRQDTLDLFLVHLLSKYSGAGATAELRMKQAGQLVQLVDSVHRFRDSSLKILTGDFNEGFKGYSMGPIEKGVVGGDSIKRILPGSRMGSYKYRGRWSQIDQFLVSGPDKNYRLSGSILELPVLLSSDETYGGKKPFRTYVGYLYNGGISDHLPILLDIESPSFLNHF